ASRGELALAGEDWTIRGAPLGPVTGTLTFERGGVGILLSSPDAGWSGQAHVDWQEGLPARGRLELERATIPLTDLAESSWIALSGSLDFEGPLSRPEAISVEGWLQHLELSAAGKRLETAEPLPVRLRDGRLSAGPLRLSGRDSAVEATLSYALDSDQVDVSANGYVDLGLLAAPLVQVRGAGRVDLSIEARGPLGS